MNKSIKDGLVIAGSAAAGGWGITRIGGILGFRLGPWGAAVGTAVGALAGFALAQKMQANGVTVTEDLTELETGEE